MEFQNTSLSFNNRSSEPGYSILQYQGTESSLQNYSYGSERIEERDQKVLEILQRKDKTIGEYKEQVIDLQVELRQKQNEISELNELVITQNELIKELQNQKLQSPYSNSENAPLEFYQLNSIGSATSRLENENNDLRELVGAQKGVNAQLYDQLNQILDGLGDQDYDLRMQVMKSVNILRQSGVESNNEIRQKYEQLEKCFEGMSLRKYELQKLNNEREQEIFDLKNEIDQLKFELNQQRDYFQIMERQYQDRLQKLQFNTQDNIHTDLDEIVRSQQVENNQLKKQLREAYTTNSNNQLTARLLDVSSETQQTMQKQSKDYLKTIDLYKLQLKSLESIISRTSGMSTARYYQQISAKDAKISQLKKQIQELRKNKPPGKQTDMSVVQSFKNEKMLARMKYFKQQKEQAENQVKELEIQLKQIKSSQQNKKKEIQQLERKQRNQMQKLASQIEQAKEECITQEQYKQMQEQIKTQQNQIQKLSMEIDRKNQLIFYYKDQMEKKQEEAKAPQQVQKNDYYKQQFDKNQQRLQDLQVQISNLKIINDDQAQKIQKQQEKLKQGVQESNRKDEIIQNLREKLVQQSHNLEVSKITAEQCDTQFNKLTDLKGQVTRKNEIIQNQKKQIENLRNELDYIQQEQIQQANSNTLTIQKLNRKQKFIHTNAIRSDQKLQSFYIVFKRIMKELGDLVSLIWLAKNEQKRHSLVQRLDKYIQSFILKLEKLDYINEDNIEVILDLMYEILDQDSKCLPDKKYIRCISNLRTQDPKQAKQKFSDINKSLKGIQ